MLRDCKRWFPRQNMAHLALLARSVLHYPCAKAPWHRCRGEIVCTRPPQTYEVPGESPWVKTAH